MVKFFLLDYVIMVKQPTRRTNRSSQYTKKYKEYKEGIQKQQKKKQASFINKNLAYLIEQMNIKPVSRRLTRHNVNGLSNRVGDVHINNSNSSTSSGNLHNGFKKLNIKGGNKTKRRNNKRSRRSLKKR